MVSYLYPVHLATCHVGEHDPIIPNVNPYITMALITRFAPAGDVPYAFTFNTLGKLMPQSGLFRLPNPRLKRCHLCGAAGLAFSDIVAKVRATGDAQCMRR